MADAPDIEVMDVDSSEKEKSSTSIKTTDVVTISEETDEMPSLEVSTNDIEICDEKNASDSVCEEKKEKSKSSDDDCEVIDSNVDASAKVDKQPSEDSEANATKPNFLLDKLNDSSPKCSPEAILADDGVLEKDTNTKNADENETTNKEVKVTSEEPATKDVPKGKESEPKSKHEGKSGKKEKKKGKLCAECGEKKKLQLRIVFQGKAYQLCSEVCYKNFKEKKSTPKPIESTEEKCSQCEKRITCGPGYYPTVGELKPLCSEECIRKYQEKHGAPKKCGQCKEQIESVYNQLTWETMLFCNEDCLGKYQSFLGSHCTCCQTPVQQTSLGKYCVCFGADIRQFCSGSCLEDFKKGLKVCSFCQTDLSSVSGDGFLAPVGDKGQFKDFCSQMCMERYESLNSANIKIPDPQECSFCKKQGSFKTQVKLGGKTYSLCCEICVAGFRCSYSIKDNMCNTCYKFFQVCSGDTICSFKHEGTPKHFCTKACMTLYVLSHRKIVQCVQCKVKKYTFDMIEKLDCNNQTLMFCSLNCLTLHRVNTQATVYKQTQIRCDNCTKTFPSQYHLTMSDASVKNFCSYQCVLTFQAKHADSVARPTNLLKAGSNPVIANVISLAQTRTAVSSQVKSPQTVVSVRQQGPVAAVSPKPQVSSSAVTSSTMPNITSTALSSSNVTREIIVRPPVPKSVKNKSASCKPIMQAKGVTAKFSTCHKAVQTDDRPMPIFLPVPVPIYIPTPMHMFSRPVPCPVPFPVPIPIPIFVESARSLKNGRENLRLATNNSYDADSAKLQMADSGVANSVNNIDKGGKATPPTEKKKNSTPLDESNSHIKNKNEPRIVPKIEPADDYSSLETKRSSSHKRAAGELESEPKKPKLDTISTHELSEDDDDDIEMVNFRIGDTNKLETNTGINAWKQWIKKHGQVSKGSTRRQKSFKTDIMQLSIDELTYSLSAFVREYKKEKGEPFCAASIFYFLLGIQRYLVDNGRKEDIFSDDGFNPLSDHFHSVLKQYEKRALTGDVPRSWFTEKYLWSAKQLGPQSPQILLNTLMYYITKYFNQKTTADHMALRFNQFKCGREEGGQRRRYLRFEYYESDSENNNDEKKPGTNGKKKYIYHYAVPDQSLKSALKCFVTMFEFYFLKCPPNLLNSNSKLYLSSLNGVSINDKLWYTQISLAQQTVEKKLQRFLLIQDCHDT